MELNHLELELGVELNFYYEAGVGIGVELFGVGVELLELDPTLG